MILSEQETKLNIYIYISEPQGPVGEVSHLSYQNPEKRKKIGAEKIKQKNFQIWLKTINVQI